MLNILSIVENVGFRQLFRVVLGQTLILLVHWNLQFFGSVNVGSCLRNVFTVAWRHKYLLFFLSGFTGWLFLIVSVLAWRNGLIQPHLDYLILNFLYTQIILLHVYRHRPLIHTFRINYKIFIKHWYVLVSFLFLFLLLISCQTFETIVLAWFTIKHLLAFSLEINAGLLCCHIISIWGI